MDHLLLVVVVVMMVDWAARPRSLKKNRNKKHPAWRLLDHLLLLVVVSSSVTVTIVDLLLGVVVTMIGTVVVL